MKLNKEKSKGLKTVLAISMAGLIAVGSGVCIAKEKSADNDEYLKNHIDFEKRKIEYLTNVENADMSLYNQELVDYYRDGILCVDNENYSLETVCLLYRNIDGERHVFLVSYREPDFDILSQSNFEKKAGDELYLFRTTEAFYSLFLNYEVNDNKMILSKNDLSMVKEILLNSSGKMHDMVPETYYKNHR